MTDAVAPVDAIEFHDEAPTDCNTEIARQDAAEPVEIASWRRWVTEAFTAHRAGVPF